MYRVLKALMLDFKKACISLKYRRTSPKIQSPYEYTANLLVVKKPIYADLARICAESFLYFNPDCKVIIHVDKQTESEVRHSLRKLLTGNRVEIRSIEIQDKSWQESKLDLILGMSHPGHFFMDADLRWNGPIPKLEGVTFFVNEFMFDSRVPYSQLKEKMKWSPLKSITMKNTSFLYWGGYVPTQGDKKFIEECMYGLNELCLRGEVSAEHTLSLLRISEQIALSVLVDFRDLEVNFLKESDGYRDGSFVESSYFGATGSAF